MFSSTDSLGGAMAAVMPWLVAIAAGAMIPLQAGANGALSRTLGHPLWATLCSLMVSVALTLLLLALLRVAPPGVASVRAPGWMWLGGAYGAFYVTAALMLAPRLGAAGFLAAVVAGQMIMALCLDHAGAGGFPLREVTLPRLAGALLVVLGVAAMQWGGTARMATAD